MQQQLKSKLTYMEYQVNRMDHWIFCSYKTYLKDRKKGEETRKRNLQSGPSWVR